ncbi:MAG: hypothetical protein JWO45_984 [Spartobacteria bacterium]|nr:hypothetical protein [Spartobacteria bacterium]
MNGSGNGSDDYKSVIIIKAKFVAPKEVGRMLFLLRKANRTSESIHPVGPGSNPAQTERFTRDLEK